MNVLHDFLFSLQCLGNYPFLMSIATKTGDGGTTGLMYNRRVSKCDARVEAYGAVDEVTAALGMARAHSEHTYVSERVYEIQKDLVTVMGELATATGDLERYAKDGFKLVGGELTAKLDAIVSYVESQDISFKGWATPGDTLSSGALDVARTACRRSERRVAHLHETDQLKNPQILVYLNRLSDTLWLLARWVESQKSQTWPR